MVEKMSSRVPIRFIIEGLGVAKGEVIRHLAPRTVDSILRAMPLEGRAAVWKKKIYFQIPIKGGKEKSKRFVEEGTIAYWPMGAALCVFYGSMVAYSPVNPIGRITKKLELFTKVKNGTKIKVEIIRKI
ncbi:TPA: hypothetical protein EYP70_05225 [Candidatus Bathyarchaeota archaeon]|nr:hypothetical protein [Candidatus Bathyarchaeota archaeon]